ncbi:uncharacterized protein TNIN_268571 [Trichonephila inaurata madagascariensis]|uniref:DUF4219 domain-containing protein n=1 Tax=Trichonephila inaurata madagascariensis TaxID=2747483 RepID=A0A8X6MES7_9ARAC|nr:uncharacterized protein TNIN_268571 [Trichonephila inaurata madagascariensis]
MEKPDCLLFVFPVLNVSNYNQWKIDMEVLLIGSNCWEFSGNEKVEESQDAAEKQRFKWRKERTYTTIYQGVESQF